MKRDDLQAIRGVAILLVITFHLQPSRFPLGFVGVDMFFVLSGFLMALLITKEPFSGDLIRTFYVRRFKRIVPLYFATITAVFVGCAFILLPSDKDQLLTDIKWALSLLSNMQPFFEVSSYRYLVHCWSLAVELQFYLIAPFLIAFLSSRQKHLRTALTVALIVGSLCVHLFSPAKVSYDLLPSRIWQFLLGVLCYFDSDPKNPTAEKNLSFVDGGEEEALIQPKNAADVQEVVVCTRTNVLSETVLLVVVLLVLVDAEVIITRKMMRLISCLAVCLLIRFSVPQSLSFLTNRLLVYFGDLSYTMYLVHWPLIVLVKYVYNIHELGITGTFVVFFFIQIATILVHYLIEKPLISSGTIGVAVCTICLGIIGLGSPFYSSCCTNFKGGKIGDIDLGDAIAWNLKESQKVFYQLPCDPDNVTSEWTGDDREPQLRCQTVGNGTLNVLVLGNSIAYRAFPYIEKVLQGKFKELRLFSRSSSPPLSNKNRNFTAAAHIVVKKIRPDLIWHVHSEIDDVFLKPIKSLKQDEAFLDFQENLEFYLNRTKLMIIDLPYYWTKIRVGYEMTKRLQQGHSVQDLKIESKLALEQQKFHKERLLSLNCSHCLYNDPESIMFQKETFFFYNQTNLHAYLGDGHHFTPEFLDLLEPVYEKTVETALRRLL